MTDDYEDEDEDESSFSLFDLVLALGQEKWTILGIDFVLTAAVVLASLLVPNTYTARSMLLPPQQSQSSAGSALAALGALSSGLGGAAGVKSPDELYVGFLKSDSITDSIVERFKLIERYEVKSLSAARLALAQRVAITADRKSGLIRIEASDADPVFAATLANAFSDELKSLMNRIAVTEASQRRLFFEQQAGRAKTSLAQAELAFKAAQDKFGIQSIDVRVQGDIRASGDLRAQIMMRDVQMQAMRSYAGPENADIQRLAAEVGSLKAQLAKVEQGAGADTPVSEAAFANQRAYREVKYQEAILAGLIAQTELARGDEARQAPLVQQVDVARPPDHKSAPKRAQWAVIGVVAGFFVAVAFVLLRRSWRLRQQDAEGRGRWQLMRDAWLGTSARSSAETSGD